MFPDQNNIPRYYLMQGFLYFSSTPVKITTFPNSNYFSRYGGVQMLWIFGINIYTQRIHR